MVRLTRSILPAFLALALLPERALALQIDFDYGSINLDPESLIDLCAVPGGCNPGGYYQVTLSSWRFDLFGLDVATAHTPARVFVANDWPSDPTGFGVACAPLCDAWQLTFDYRSAGGRGMSDVYVRVILGDSSGTALAGNAFVVPESLRGWDSNFILSSPPHWGYGTASWTVVPEVGTSALVVFSLASLGAIRACKSVAAPRVL